MADWRGFDISAVYKIDGVVFRDSRPFAHIVVNYAASGVPFAQVLQMLTNGGGVAHG